MDPLFLIGFAAAGKTTVGRALAGRLSRRFLDLDEVIEEEAGEPVPSLVAHDLERFRKIEAAALRYVIEDADRLGDAPIIACGGGAAAHGKNLARMRAAGLVVTLAIDAKTAVARAADVTTRPLLAQPWRAVAELAASREPYYRRAHAIVDASQRVDRVVDDVLAVADRYHQLGEQRHEAILLGLGERSYPIALQPRLAEVLAPHRPSGRAVIISDDNVAPRWLDALRAALGEAHASAPSLVVPAGEASKSFATYQDLCERLIRLGVDRATTVIALGGGVVGDLAGFVAATALRGLAVVHVPTTLVAMTDSAIGGKTAIDSAAGKNLIGAFWQPRAVVAALETLTTLPARERRAGFGELWKYALLDGEDMWSAVEACAAWAADGGDPPGELAEVIRRSAGYKAHVVVRDERETRGLRVMLNLGHTLGHAFETAAGGALLHGEAVALGLMAACRVSQQVVGCAPNLEERLADALTRSGLAADFAPHLGEKAWDALSLDKKRSGSAVRFIAIRDVGRCEVVELELAELRRILRPSAAV
ncbi:MAG: 3-dehydroquinate synthase [Kofleriaceae bacterium]